MKDKPLSQLARTLAVCVTCVVLSVVTGVTLYVLDDSPACECDHHCPCNLGDSCPCPVGCPCEDGGCCEGGSCPVVFP